CKACYSCVRNCPANAVKVEMGQARVVEERCVSCGNCVRVCSQQAKEIETQVAEVRDMLAGGRKVVAFLAPSFPASFYFIKPEELFILMKESGFSEVEEVAGGVELAIPKYRDLITAGDMETIISSHCPAVVGLIEKQFPGLIPMLAPVDSAMMAAAKYMRQKHPGAKMVFFGPCIAKKEEAKVFGRGIIDAVLTFRELKELLGLKQVDGEDADCFNGGGRIKADSPLFPLPGGFMKNVDPAGKLFKFEDIAMVEGKDECLQFLESLSAGRIKPRLVDILFCKGCIDGPEINSPLDVFTRQHLIYSYARQRDKAVLRPGVDLNLYRQFTDRHQPLAIPSETEIQAILRHTYKTRPEDELNCGSCGYNSCREKAVAVYQALAEIDMCLPYLLAKSRGEAEYYKTQLD
ncbi:sigma-54-dependent Fis family transcriptional regulator, partial [bacterium]